MALEIMQIEWKLIKQGGIINDFNTALLKFSYRDNAVAATDARSRPQWGTAQYHWDAAKPGIQIQAEAENVCRAAIGLPPLVVPVP